MLNNALLFKNHFRRVFRKVVPVLLLGIANRIHGLRFSFRDRFMRFPYKVTRCTSEFGSELKWYVPFAYWHHLNGTLLRTESCKDTKELYFFNSNHVELDVNRDGDDMFQLGIPNSEDHNFRYDLSKWAQVPYKKVFGGQFESPFLLPLLIISNKYNIEWGHDPVNYMSIKLLETLCAELTCSYQIVYNRPGPNLITNDNSDILNLDDKKFLRENYPQVKMAEDLYSEHKSSFRNFNHFQLALYASCDRFLSVQGGNSVLASYFGGTNIVLFKKGFELLFEEYTNFYPKLSGTKILLCTDDHQFIDCIRKEYCS